MALFVLVHGAAQGAWCWEKVLPQLRDGGNTVIAPDLPGHGNDRTPLALVTMDRYVEAVCSAMATQNGKAVLVGHDIGGAVISLVAETMPSSVDRLIFVSGLVPVPGQTLGELMQADEESLMPEAFDASDDNSYITAIAEKAAEAFYSGCSPDDTSAAVSRLTPQAVSPMFQPMELSAERFGTVPRFGIVCTEDRAVTPEFQEQVYGTIGCSSVVKLAAGHAPFLSKPDELVKVLKELAGR